MTDWVLAYLWITFVVALFASLVVFMPGHPADKEWGARVLLACWAWPLWAAALVALAFVKTWRTANLLNTTKGRNHD